MRRRLRGSLLAIAILVLGSTAVTPVRQVYSQHQRIAAEEQRLAELRRGNAALERELRRHQDPAYVEKLVRRQLGLVRPGEVSYLIPEQDPEGATQPPAAEARPWYRRVWDGLRDLMGAGRPRP
ncbi:MAG: FtsB family cell division protein [Candidatus Methylomirabilales bacterium]